jgi:flavin-dependent dehydrogenase
MEGRFGIVYYALLSITSLHWVYMLGALYEQRVTLQKNTSLYNHKQANQTEVRVELRTYAAPLLPIQRLHSSTDRLSVPSGVVIGDAAEKCTGYTEAVKCS